MLALTVLLVLTGRVFGTRSGTGTLQRWTLQFLAGAVAFHLLLTSLDFLGVPWSRAALVLPLGAVAALGLRRRRERMGLPSDLGWGDAAALFALIVFGLFALTLWTATPDFLFHWGIKGHRFFLTRGVDYAWLAKEWNFVVHPDYPNLLPELFAGTALLAGRFEEPALMLWSVLFFALLLAAGREALRQAGVPRPLAQAGLAALAFALAAFGLGNRMAGAADWMPALALVAAMPALLRPPDPAGDLEVGIAAAFAAASKLEGMPLAASLAGVQFLRRIAAERRIDLQAALPLGMFTAAVSVPWALRTFHHGLYQNFNTGTLDLDRAPVVFRALINTLAGENWHGLNTIMLALPLLLLLRRTRAIAAVVSLQTFFYFWIYFSATMDIEFLVVSSFPRLALHLVPAVLLAGIIALGKEGRELVNPTSPPRSCSRSKTSPTSIRISTPTSFQPSTRIWLRTWFRPYLPRSLRISPPSCPASWRRSR